MYTYCIYSSKRNYLYVGITENLERRFKEHQSGKNKTTKPYRPFQLVLSENYSSRNEARQREKYLKSGIGKEYLRMIIQFL